MVWNLKVAYQEEYLTIIDGLAVYLLAEATRKIVPKINGLLSESDEYKKSLEEDLRTLNAKKAEMTRMLDEWETRIMQIDKSLSALDKSLAELDKIQERYKITHDKYERGRSEYQSEWQKWEDAHAQIAEIMENSASLEADKKNIERKMEEYERKNCGRDNLRHYLTTSLSAQISRLENQIKAFGAKTNFNEVLKNVKSLFSPSNTNSLQFLATAIVTQMKVSRTDDADVKNYFAESVDRLMRKELDVGRFNAGVVFSKEGSTVTAEDFFRSFREFIGINSKPIIIEARRETISYKRQMPLDEKFELGDGDAKMELPNQGRYTTIYKEKDNDKRQYNRQRRTDPDDAEVQYWDQIYRSIGNDIMGMAADAYDDIEDKIGDCYLTEMPYNQAIAELKRVITETFSIINTHIRRKVSTGGKIIPSIERALGGIRDSRLKSSLSKIIYSQIIAEVSSKLYDEINYLHRNNLVSPGQMDDLNALTDALSNLKRSSSADILSESMDTESTETNIMASEMADRDAQISISVMQKMAESPYLEDKLDFLCDGKIPYDGSAKTNQMLMKP